MADEKDGPPKGAPRRPGEGAGPTPKRPFSTLDLKATDVSPKPPQWTKDADAPAGRPPTGSAPTEPHREGARPGNDQSAAAAKVVAASAAGRRSSDATASTSAKPSSASAPGPEPSSRLDAPRAGGSGGGARAYGSHLAAGIAGGLLALLGSYFVGSPDPTGSSTAMQELASRLASVEQAAKERGERLQTVQTGLAKLDDVSKTVGSLNEAQARLAEGLQSAMGQRASDTETAQRVAKLEEQLSAIAAAAADPQSAGRIGQLAQITGKLADLEASTAERIGALRKDLNAEAEARVAPVAEASEAAKSGTQRLDREVAGVRSETARLGQRIDAVKAGTDRLEQGLRSLQAEAGGLKTGLETFRTEVEGQLKSAAKPADVSSAVAPVAAKVSALEQSVQSVVRTEEDRQTSAERIVLSLELGDLKRAMDRGGSYTAELAPIKKRGSVKADLSAIERYQHDGVPTQAELVRSFRSVANAILDADAEQPDASVVERLLSGARSIVRVRKVTHPAGDRSTEAVVGRMETALKEGRLDDVLAEAKTLPPRAAVPADDWLRKVEARQSVDKAIAAIDAELKVSLGSAAPAAQRSDRQ